MPCSLSSTLSLHKPHTSHTCLCVFPISFLSFHSANANNGVTWHLICMRRDTWLLAPFVSRGVCRSRRGRLMREGGGSPDSFFFFLLSLVLSCAIYRATACLKIFFLSFNYSRLSSNLFYSVCWMRINNSSPFSWAMHFHSRLRIEHLKKPN